MPRQFFKNSRVFRMDIASIERANKRDLCRAQRDCRRHHINRATLLDFPRKGVVALARELESRPGDNIRSRRRGPLML